MRGPAGAFYAFPNVAARLFRRGSRNAAAGGCRRGHRSGSAFGREASAHLRLSYANSRENLRLALQRIEALLLEHPG